MRTFTCIVCGKPISCRGNKRVRKFCSLECCWKHRQGKCGPGCFRAGHKGTRMLPVGAVTFRVHRGKTRVWVKLGDPGVWKPHAIAVWESLHGTIPKGMIVHHLDGNTLNDSPKNLAIVGRDAHAGIHLPESDAKRRASLKQRQEAKRKLLGIPETVSCCWCGKLLRRTPSTYLRHSTHFCSRSCWSHYQNKVRRNQTVA